jgi:hypothetical protein
LIAEVGVVGHLRCGVRGRVVVLLVFGEGGRVLAEQLLAISVVCVDHIDAGRAAGRCLSWAHARLVAWETIWTRVSKVLNLEMHTKLTRRNTQAIWSAWWRHIPWRVMLRCVSLAFR